MSTNVKNLVRSKDIVISKEILDLFKNSIRVVDRLHPAGMWPVDMYKLKDLQERLPELFKESDIMSRYDIGIVYKDKTIQKEALQRRGVKSRVKVTKNDLSKVELTGSRGAKVMKDFSKIGLVSIEDRIIRRIPLCGILVPWRWLKKANIDHRKFDLVLTPKL